MAFIPWNFEPINTLMHEEGLVEYGTGGVQTFEDDCNLQTGL